MSLLFGIANPKCGEHSEFIGTKKTKLSTQTVGMYVSSEVCYAPPIVGPEALAD